MTTAVLALGANLGDREDQLRTAVAGLGDVLLAVSGLYETPPWGDTDAPPYLNAVVLAADPSSDATDWLRRCQRLEDTAGRRRDPARRYAPRTLDADVIAVFTDGLTSPVTSDSAELTLPHPRAAQRAFVLVPLHEIAPDLVLPGEGPVATLLDRPEVAADVPGVRRHGGDNWWKAEPR